MPFDFRLGSIAVLAMGAFALAGCGGGDKSEPAKDGAKPAAMADIKPAPGRYEAQFKLTKMEMPGMPAGLQEMFKEQLNKVETSVSCLTKEQAEKAEQDFFRPPETSGNECKYSNFEMGGGKIAAQMTCQEGNMKQDMVMTGTYGADAYAMHIKADGNQGNQKMSVEMEVASRRVGDCDETEKG
ncbi:MAG: DUF3617 domain-containing protein [Novosphingobium sp.]